ncbi:hypothetical protein FRC16_003481 [Serendipita sp. 398]|nr:hypothetical protein FRC16_003481 [Serendipita sp. 398]
MLVSDRSLLNNQSLTCTTVEVLQRFVGAISSLILSCASLLLIMVVNQKLAANRAAKQEEYENSHKLSAQFRSLDPDEINFLDSVALKKFHEEQVVKKNDEEQLKDFRAAFETPYGRNCDSLNER